MSEIDDQRLAQLQLTSALNYLDRALPDPTEVMQSLPFRTYSVLVQAGVTNPLTLTSCLITLGLLTKKLDLSDIDAAYGNRIARTADLALRGPREAMTEHFARIGRYSEIDTGVVFSAKTIVVGGRIANWLVVQARAMPHERREYIVETVEHIMPYATEVGLDTQLNNMIAHTTTFYSDDFTRH